MCFCGPHTLPLHDVCNRFDGHAHAFEALTHSIHIDAGRGLERPFRLTDELFYEVPLDKRAQLLYFRAGNSTDAMIYVMLRQNDRPKWYFPIGARADSHVTLAITEDIESGHRFEVFMAAPELLSGWIVIDIGLIEF